MPTPWHWVDSEWMYCTLDHYCHFEFLAFLDTCRTWVQPGSDKNALTTATMLYGSTYNGLCCLGIWYLDCKYRWIEGRSQRWSKNLTQSTRDTKEPRRTWRQVRGAASFAEVDILILLPRCCRGSEASTAPCCHPCSHSPSADDRVGLSVSLNHQIKHFVFSYRLDMSGSSCDLGNWALTRFCVKTMRIVFSCCTPL